MIQIGLPTLVGVRLATAIAMTVAGVMLVYAAATLPPGMSFSERWPSMHTLRRVVVAGLGALCLGWGVHQWWWWGHDHSRAIGALEVARWMSEMSPVLVPVHLVIIAGGCATVAPAARELFGRWWPVLATGAALASAGLGVMLASR